MTALLLDHLWQSTLFAVAIAALAWALRRNGAHVRYWLWLTASVKFLIPFSLLTFAGSQLGSGAPSGLRFERLNQLISVTMAPATARAASGARPVEDLSGQAVESAQSNAAPLQPVIDNSGPGVLLAGAGITWFAGTGMVLLLWLSRWLRVRQLVRDATPFHDPRVSGMPVPVLESPSSVEPGIAGIFRPVLLLPKGLVARLSASQLRAVLAHEFEHWRRRDNLTASIQMLVEALFWFHPLVWWIGAQLVREREDACDESVLKQTATPHDYAEGILNICQHYVAPPLRSASISGGDLRQRIQKITTNVTPEGLGMARKIVLASLAVCAVIAPVLLGSANAAQAPKVLREADHAGLDALYNAAKQEGEVTVMAVSDRESAWMSAAFAEAFPGIRIRLLSSLVQLPPVVMDAESRRPGFDVILTGQMEAQLLDKGSYLANMDWTPFNIPANQTGVNGRFAFTDNFVFTVSYDKRRVGKEGIPVYWRDLLAPQYHGLMSTNAFVMPRIVAGLGLSWGEVEAESYVRQLKNQNLLNSFGDARGFFLNEGAPHRYFIGMASSVTEQWQKEGLPFFEYVVPQPVVMEQRGAAVLATAPHPAAARLLAGWLATEKAKAIRHREAQTTDLLPGSSDPQALALRARQVPIVYDTSQTAGERARLTQKFLPFFAAEDYYNPPKETAFSLLNGVLPN